MGSFPETLIDSKSLPFQTKTDTCNVALGKSRGVFVLHEKKTIPKIRANANSPLIVSLPDTLTPNMYSRVICNPVVDDVLMSFFTL